MSSFLTDFVCSCSDGAATDKAVGRPGALVDAAGSKAGVGVGAPSNELPGARPARRPSRAARPARRRRTSAPASTASWASKRAAESGSTLRPTRPPPCVFFLLCLGEAEGLHISASPQAAGALV